MEPARAAGVWNPPHCSSAPIRMPLQVTPKPDKVGEELANTKTEVERRDSAEREKNKISQDAALLLSPSPRGTWTAFQNRCWLRLLEDAPKMRTEANMRAAFQVLVDCFPFLEKEEDKEKTVDMVYDCCEPDVTFEVRASCSGHAQSS